MTRLPTPDLDDAVRWVARHLGDLALEGSDGVAASRRFTGGQTAADDALAAFDVRGYAAQRNEVLPEEDRGASGLSPYIRHGLLPLPRVWDHVAGGPARDVGKFRDELLWQEYARHVYARVGRRIATPLRREPAVGHGWSGDPYPEGMACMAAVRHELVTDGWLVNQTRLWAASQWTVRAGWDWREGERALYRHLVDGSPAANGVGWQWAVGAGTGKPYGFSRWQVEKRAPGLCASCPLNRACPVQDFPAAQAGPQVDPVPGLAADQDPTATAGPLVAELRGEPEAVWLTAESLGDADPALAASPDLPAVFVFDEPLLRGLRLSGKRLVFLAETLADLAQRREVEVHRGVVPEVLAGRPLAATWAPVPGFRARSARLDMAALHPWPWLRRPAGGSARSFTAWVDHHGGSPTPHRGGRPTAARRRR
ncbi:FAD-binding domain-containing protein [Amnibacterium kyonggiense]|uniref:Deoxyribodipyrimidine photo-lyase n=1 Tax=Amnibacterium kyonggiense TaxID=595671 RepID=A0A4V3EAJ9_9MICO|nr:FAD-binding domain-containing protein [Amnibacterium kyonggiense]TDS76924.1 deoxyribodipyrimidine photo-lyase [Amnibacterium kyonggiense]